jgi:hypothetical protein
MIHSDERTRNRLAGGLLVLVGAGVILEASRYTIGNVARMGPGFFPALLGVILVVTGVLIAVTRGEAEAAEDHAVAGPPDWRGWLCIILGIVSFIALGDHAGFAPATFACVFISALGDRAASLRSSALLAAVVTVLGTLVFCYGLQLQIPMLRW